MTSNGQVARGGFTLVELLVVIAIIGILIALLLPAVQAAREAARRTQCANQLKQTGVAVLTHEAIHGHYPTGGWGWKWIGDPDRGFGKRQPGGWIYNILPFIEQGDLHDMGAGLKTLDKYQALSKMIQIPIPGFHCPSRRAAVVYPAVSYAFTYYNTTGDAPEQAKTDYAVNVGDYNIAGTVGINFAGPSSMNQVDMGLYNGWPNFIDKLTGVSYLLSTVRSSDISDGTSNTYLAGEKSLATQHYTTGKEWADDNTLYGGYDWDIMRWASPTYKLVPDHRVEPFDPSGRYSNYHFGSAHATGINFVFCDGSTHAVPYDIDPLVHARLGNRYDGNPVDKEGYMP